MSLIKEQSKLISSLQRAIEGLNELSENARDVVKDVAKDVVLDVVKDVQSAQDVQDVQECSQQKIIR